MNMSAAWPPRDSRIKDRFILRQAFVYQDILSKYTLT
jgi:hypothetical protein